MPVAADMTKIHAPRDLLHLIDEQNELGMRYADLSLGNRGVTPGDRNRLIVVYEAGFDMHAFMPEGTKTSFAYDKLNGVFTRTQLIFFNSSDPDAPITFYLNYDSELYSLSVIEKFCREYNNALMWMITEGEQ